MLLKMPPFYRGLSLYVAQGSVGNRTVFNFLSKLVYGSAWSLLYSVRHLDGRRGRFDGYFLQIGQSEKIQIKHHKIDR